MGFIAYIFTIHKFSTCIEAFPRQHGSTTICHTFGDLVFYLLSATNIQAKVCSNPGGSNSFVLSVSFVFNCIGVF